MSTTIRHGPFTIRRSDPELVPLELRPHTFCASNVVTWALWVFYISVQFYSARVLQNGSSRLLWQMWLILIAELCLSFQEVVLGINLIFAIFFAAESRTRPRYHLIGDSAPTIDVFIPCCGEQIDVICDTVAAVIAQDYPPERLQVLILDDGHDTALCNAIESLGYASKKTGGPKVHYLSRDAKPGVESFFKAGNLQFGIEESKRLGGSEFLASLDADMIPEEDWLRRMVPHLLLNGDMGLACPPQCYYNVPNHDPLGQKSEFDLWFSVYEPLNDRLDSAMCTGSGFVVRRSALEEIGGWPQAVAGEDVMCSSVLSNNGWKVAFIREDLQSGLAPNTLRSHIRQRMRWVDAAIELHKQFDFYIPGSKKNLQLTWMQRAVGMLWALREYAPLTNVLALLLLPLALLFYPQDRINLVTMKRSISWTWTSFLIYFISKKINNYMMFNHVGLRRVLNFQSLDIWGAPYISSRCLVSLLPSSTISTFEVSGSSLAGVNERSALHRKPLPDRLLSPDMLMYSTYIAYASTPLLIRLFAAGGARKHLDILTMFPGSTLKLLDCIAKASVPIWYMTFPPTVPERETMMAADDRGVRRPKKTYSGSRSNFEWYSVLDVCVIGLMWWSSN